MQLIHQFLVIDSMKMRHEGKLDRTHKRYIIILSQRHSNTDPYYNHLIGLSVFRIISSFLHFRSVSFVTIV